MKIIKNSLKFFILLIFLSIFRNVFCTFSERDFKSNFAFSSKRKDFGYFSGQIKTYIFTGNMYSYNSVKCNLKSKRSVYNTAGIPIIEFSVGSCKEITYGRDGRVSITKVYIVGSGVNHRFSGTKTGGHIIFPKLAYFPRRYTDGFIY